MVYMVYGSISSLFAEPSKVSKIHLLGLCVNKVYCLGTHKWVGLEEDVVKHKIEKADSKIVPILPLSISSVLVIVFAVDDQVWK
jgi:hypothetical protein